METWITFPPSSTDPKMHRHAKYRAFFEAKLIERGVEVHNEVSLKP